jgi:hypothetical protein
MASFHYSLFFVQFEENLSQHRAKVMFFAGNMGPSPHQQDGTGRGGAWVYYGNNTRFFIAPRGIYPHHVHFHDAMLNSDFCYSPLGGHGGDTGLLKVIASWVRLISCTTYVLL